MKLKKIFGFEVVVIIKSMDNAKITLKNFGYDDFFESSRASLGLANYSVARVVAEYRGVYKVKNIEGEFLAKVTGKHMYASTKREDYPAVGDWVAIEELSKE